jgi:Tfp pilus assembly protein PilE
MWNPAHPPASPGLVPSAGRARRRALASLAALLLMTLAFVLVRAPQAQAGAVLFSDDFESSAVGTVPAGWTPVAGTWSVQVDGTHVLKQTSTNTAVKSEIVAGSPSWTDYVLQAQVKPGANDLYDATTVVARYRDTNNHYSFLLKANNQWYLGKVVQGIWTTFSTGTYSYTSTFYTMTLSVQGTTISGAINGKTLATKTDTSFTSGLIGFNTRATAEIDNVTVSDASVAPPPTSTPSASPAPSPTATATASPTASPSPSPTATATPSPTPIPGSSAGSARLTVTSSASGVWVQSLDASNNGWKLFFKHSAGDVITNVQEINGGVATELEAQNTDHGLLQMYLQASGVWISNLQQSGTLTLLRDTPELVGLQTVSTTASYHVRWTTTYYIWPDGQIFIHITATNTGSSALTLSSTDSVELDLGGLALATYKDTAPKAWYVTNGTVYSPIPLSRTSREAALFGHMTTVAVPPPSTGLLLDKYTTWASQGVTSYGISEAQNTSRAKDQWRGNLAQLTAGQSLSFQFLLAELRQLTSSQSVALDADYRSPALTATVGTLATTDDEPGAVALANGYNRDTGNYVIAAAGGQVSLQLGFPSGVSMRWAPRFKITGWDKDAPTARWDGVPLAAGTDYSYAVDSATHTLYLQLAFDVVQSGAGPGQRDNGTLDVG